LPAAGDAGTKSARPVRLVKQGKRGTSATAGGTEKTRKHLRHKHWEKKKAPVRSTQKQRGTRAPVTSKRNWARPFRRTQARLREAERKGRQKNRNTYRLVKVILGERGSRRNKKVWGEFAPRDRKTSLVSL